MAADDLYLDDLDALAVTNAERGVWKQIEIVLSEWGFAVGERKILVMALQQAVWGDREADPNSIQFLDIYIPPGTFFRTNSGGDLVMRNKDSGRNFPILRPGDLQPRSPDAYNKWHRAIQKRVYNGLHDGEKVAF